MKSQNFDFLRARNRELAGLGGFAEQYAHSDPASALVICVWIKQLADAAGRATVEAERQMHGVAPPKAVDNAIMNFVRLYRPAAEPTRLLAGIAVDAPDDGAG